MTNPAQREADRVATVHAMGLRLSRLDYAQLQRFLRQPLWKKQLSLHIGRRVRRPVKVSLAPDKPRHREQKAEAAR
jgi:hypothetical protein